MNTITETWRSFDLIKVEKNFELVVSNKLQAKIEYLLGKFPNREYSGTLFYKVTGNIEKEDLEVYAIDFFLQDIGTTTYTEFEQSPDLVAYMVNHSELLKNGVYQGLMH